MPASPADRAAPLALSNVVAGYGGRSVLGGLTLSIGAGEAFALLGPNGAGKSTAARVAGGLLRPSRGTVRIDGQDPWDGRMSARRRIGLAPQDCALFPALTIRENLQTMARLAGLAGPERAAGVERALRLTSSGPRADQRVSTLSGGWRRRANLAAALVTRPPLLVIDEPTEGVDAATRVSIAHAVREALGDGSGCLIISHDIPFVEMTADRIGVLVAGKLVTEGPREALLQQAFANRRLLTARFATPPSEGLAGRLGALGLAGSGDGASWRLIGADVFARAEEIASLVDEGGGEMAIRRPALDDLVASLLDRAA